MPTTSTRRWSAFFGITAGLLAVTTPLTGQDPNGWVPRLPVDTFRLSNGLRVVVSEDHSAPVVAVTMWYHVGTAHEEEGRRGVAHLLRRLVARQAKALEPGAVDGLVSGAGGYSDSALGPDRTAFVEVLPSNRVNLALWLHAERMGRPRITARVHEAWRRVMEEESSARMDLGFHGRARLALDTLSQDFRPYRRGPPGSTPDPDDARPDHVEAFHQRYYVPSNAVLTVVGDVDPRRVREMVERHFGPLAAGAPAPELPEPPPSPRVDGERRLELDDPGALVWIAWGVPPSGHPDRHALELLQVILSQGAGSRLRLRLAETDGPRVEVAGLLDLRVGPGTLRVGALPARGVDVDGVETRIAEEVGRLRREGVTARELTRAVNRRRSELVGQLLTVRGKASALQWHALHQGSAHALNDEMARYVAVTAADVRRVARTYLVPANRTVVVVRPGPGDEGGGP